MPSRTAIGATLATMVVGTILARSALQTPGVRSVDESVLREHAGVYQWDTKAFLYLQMWSEFSTTHQLGAFDESGELRALYPTDRERFFTGPGAAVSSSIESRVEFQRDASGRIASLTWQRESAPPRTARRVDVEKHEDVRFQSGEIRQPGTLITPITGTRHPAIILVHGSGPQNRESILPFARFLVRHGMAVLGYDKRGVGGSSGDWNTASFDDLAGDVIAAFEYLKTRSDIDSRQIAARGEGWQQRGNAAIAAIRAGVLHDDHRLAFDANSWFQAGLSKLRSGRPVAPADLVDGEARVIAAGHGIVVQDVFADRLRREVPEHGRRAD